MKIAVLQTDHLAPEMQATYGDYDKIYGDFLGSRLKNAEIVIFPVIDEIFPASPDEADGYILTGSKYGAYEDEPFIHKTKAFIQQIVAVDKPIFGICFGHQIIAEALGGKVIKWPEGWNCGVTSYQVVDKEAAFGFTFDEVNLNAFHQDQVVTLPEGAKTFLSTQNCKNAGISYKNGQIMTLQPHPEFPNKFTEDLTKLRRARLGDDFTDKTLASFDQETKGEDVMDFIAAFFEKEIAKV